MMSKHGESIDPKSNDVDLDVLIEAIDADNVHSEVDFGSHATIDHTFPTPTDLNIFADLELPDAGSLRVKAILMAEITRIWRESELDQKVMAKRMGAAPACFSDIVKGRIGECSIETMIDMLSAVDKRVALTICDVNRSLG